MTPARCHALLGAGHLAAATRQSDDLRRGLLAALGVRHLGQALWLRRATAGRRRVARLVDATHGLTAVGWALSAPDRRGEGTLSVALSALAVRAERG